MRIGVIGVPGRWSSEHLADQFGEKTGYRLLLSSDDITLRLETLQAASNQSDLSSLDALVVKKLGPDYSHHIMDRVEVLRAIASSGLQVFPHPDAIAKAVNRLSCTVALREADIPIPETVITEDLDEAYETVQRFGKAIFKPLFTSKARGMMFFDAKHTAPGELKEFREAGNPVMYIQKKVDIPGRDLGVVFLGEEYLATYARVGTSDSWNTTTVFGGRYAKHEPSAEVLAVAKAAQSVFGLQFTSVDVAETTDGPLVFEVSAFGGFRGLKETQEIDAGKLYADHILELLTRDDSPV